MEYGHDGRATPLLQRSRNGDGAARQPDDSSAQQTVGETTLGRALRIAGLPQMRNRPRIFRLRRLADYSGVSGIGQIAEGVVFSDGTVVLRWRSAHPTTTIFDCLDDVIRIHGHGGASRVQFDDEYDEKGEPA